MAFFLRRSLRTRSNQTIIISCVRFLRIQASIQMKELKAKSENGLFRKIYNFSLRAKNGLINISLDIDLNGLCDKRFMLRAPYSKYKSCSISDKSIECVRFKPERVWLQAKYTQIAEKKNLSITTMQGILYIQFVLFCRLEQGYRLVVKSLFVLLVLIQIPISKI